ncbi:MAG: TerB family tellurite resistance protein [Spirochaetota bacterium]
MVQKIHTSKTLKYNLNLAKHLVSLWYYALMSDGKIGNLELEMRDEMLEELFEEGRIFYHHQEGKNLIINELMEYFHSPLPMPQVVAFIQENRQYANLFYEDACSMVIADMLVKKSEKKFLEKLAADLEIFPLERDIIHRKYLIHN